MLWSSGASDVAERYESLQSTCRHLVRFLHQSANYARAAELDSFADSLTKAAKTLDRALRYALSAPPDESRPPSDAFVDDMVRTLRDPRMAPNRVQVLWSFGMLRRARTIVRRYLAAAEITEPAEEIAIAQAWLDEIDRGP